jgi:ABC-type sugar transport system permease subunit
MLRRKGILILMIPALALYLALFIYPAVQSFWVSLHEWSGFTAQMKWVGLANYKELLHDDLFWMTLGTTMKILFIGGVLIFVLSFLFTFFLSAGIKGKKIFRAVIFYPNVVAPIALATFWSFLYNPRFGLINGVLRSLGLEVLTQTWTGPDLIFWSVLVSLVWTYVGFFLVIISSGVEKIPADYYDAAKIAGATRVQMFFKVTIPLTWDVLMVSVVLWIITAVKMFEFLFAFSGGISAPKPLWSNAVYMFVLSFGRRVAIFRLGYGTTVSVTLLVLIVVFTGIARLAMRRERVEF